MPRRSKKSVTGGSSEADFDEFGTLEQRSRAADRWCFARLCLGVPAQRVRIAEANLYAGATFQRRMNGISRRKTTPSVDCMRKLLRMSADAGGDLALRMEPGWISDAIARFALSPEGGQSPDGGCPITAWQRRNALDLLREIAPGRALRVFEQLALRASRNLPTLEQPNRDSNRSVAATVDAALSIDDDLMPDEDDDDIMPDEDDGDDYIMPDSPIGAADNADDAMPNALETAAAAAYADEKRRKEID
jgi:hypothetical protein